MFHKAKVKESCQALKTTFCIHSQGFGFVVCSENPNLNSCFQVLLKGILFGFFYPRIPKLGIKLKETGKLVGL